MNNLTNNQKLNVLLTSYSGIPSPNFGGPNKVIYELLKKIHKESLNVGYVSKNFQAKLISHDVFFPSIFGANLKTNIGAWLFKHSKIYKKIVRHPIYLNYHFKKANLFFKKAGIYYEDYDVIHCNDIRSVYHNINKIRGKLLLTIHSRGNIRMDLENYVKTNRRINERLNEFDHMENEVISKAHHIVFPSNAAKELFLSSKQFWKINESKISIIYNGIDLEHIDSIPAKKDLLKKLKLVGDWNLKIINIADHIKDKRIDRIIDVIAILKHKYSINILLINVGSGVLTDQLIDKVNNLGLKSNVRFLGNMSNDDVLNLIKSSDIMLSLSDNVVFDYAVLEAMGCRKIVIASDVGGNREIIQNNKNGYLVNDSIDEIANIIINVNNDVGSNARSTILKFTNSVMAENYKNLYLLLSQN